jgi:phage terminase large subunit-like protein
LNIKDKESYLADLQRYERLLKFAWVCYAPGPDGSCPTNGRPHRGHPHPHARAEQLPPEGDWWAWFLMAGRGAGKTRTGGEYVKQRMLNEPFTRVAIIERDRQTGREVTIEGESGLMGSYDGEGCIPWDRIEQWNKSDAVLTLKNGSQAKVFGTDTRADAEKLRGYQCHVAWFEELGTQRYGQVAWDMLEFALRLGKDPRIVVTSTPRPIPLIKKLVKDPDVVVTRASTYSNAENLPERQLRRLKTKHENTTLGRQELLGELLEEAAGALWTYDIIHHCVAAPPLVRIVIGVDPAGTAKPTSDKTGIVAVGMDKDGYLYVLADKTGRYSPEEWRQIVKKLYDDLKADVVVGEKTFGGDLVAANIRTFPRDERPFFKPVNASRGKLQRFEPVVGLYEQGRVFHVGTHADMETQQVEWVPPGRFDQDGEPVPPSEFSPDNVDAMAWAVTELVLTPQAQRGGMRSPKE